MKLVGGNYLKYNKISDNEDFVIPDNITDELIRYTENANRRMKVWVRDWLLEYSPKPSKPITIYRGVTIDVCGYSTNCNNIEESDIIKKMFKFIGIRDLDKLHKGSDIKSKRGKESSWSYNADISTTFASGFASSDINVLMKTVVDPSDIVIDFTLIPEKIKDEFQYRNQNEVIINKGVYDTKIAGVWFSHRFIEWYETNGIKLVKNKGLYKA